MKRGVRCRQVADLPRIRVAEPFMLMSHVINAVETADSDMQRSFLTSLERGVNEKLLSAFRVRARMRDGDGAGLCRIDFPRRIAANAARINQRKALAHLLHLFLVLKVRAAALKNEKRRSFVWNMEIGIRNYTRL